MASLWIAPFWRQILLRQRNPLLHFSPNPLKTKLRAPGQAQLLANRKPGSSLALSNEQLDNGVDLAITTDYRTILSEIVARRLANPKLGIVFPELKTYNPLGIVRGTDLPVNFNGTHKMYLPNVRK